MTPDCPGFTDCGSSEAAGESEEWAGSDPLAAEGCLKVYKDVATGTKADRPQWQACLDDLRPGDTLIIWKIDRLGRNLVDIALTGRLREFLTELTQEVWSLERQVTGGHMGDPEVFLEELFGVRHGLLAVRTMAALSHEVYGRMCRLSAFGDAGAAGLDDLEDQFRRIAAMADSQREYLQGVIEFYQTRTGTKMTIAAERLAVIAAVTLPVTALSSVVGMNVIVNEQTRTGPLFALLAIMMIMSGTFRIWAKRKGWW